MDEEKKDFRETIDRIKFLLKKNESDLRRITRDNSFPSFLSLMVEKMASQINSAIDEEDIDTTVPIRSDLERYSSNILDLVYYKELTREEVELFKQINKLISNWLRMLKTLGINQSYQLSDPELEKYSSNLGRYNNLLEGNLTLRDMISINKALINKAKSILNSVPSGFKASRSFEEIIKHAVEEKEREDGVDTERSD